MGAFPNEDPQDSHSPSEVVEQITSISIEPGVEAEVTIVDA
jgi:small subunit ribosomal protein S20e